MNLENLEEKIFENYNIKKNIFNENIDLRRDLKFDNLDCLELFSIISEKKKINLSKEEFENMKTIKDVLKIINDNHL